MAADFNRFPISHILNRIHTVTSIHIPKVGFPKVPTVADSKALKVGNQDFGPVWVSTAMKASFAWYRKSS